MTREPTTAAEKAAAQRAHADIVAAGFDVLEAGTFITDDDRLFAQSTQSIPGTFGHPAKTVEIELSPNREDCDVLPDDPSLWHGPTSNPYTLCPHCGATHHEDDAHECEPPNREDCDQCPACSGVGGPIETDRCWVQVCPTCNGSGAVPLGG